MAKLTVYNFISANGFYKGYNEDISWAKRSSATKEERDFAAQNLQGGSILLFGRKTYEMMKSYWPTQQAAKDNPDVAKGMNKAEKIVFSESLQQAEWNNTRIVKNMEDEIKRLKSQGKNMTVLGSGSIVTQLAEKGLIDELQLMVHPVLLDSGTPLFDHARISLNLVLDNARPFKSGLVLLTYKPAGKLTADKQQQTMETQEA